MLGYAGVTAIDGPYLEGHGDLITMLIMGIIGLLYEL